jgi:uncharacterized protein (TIGR00288 family)
MKKIMKNLKENRLAVLIDGDNAQPNKIEYILHEIVKYGVITIRRIYGDWTTPQMDSWKKYLVTNAIQPVQQFRNTIGKNATDSAMIIDAMDILYTRKVETFVLISSDSDYTKLAIRLREEGKFVIGIGQKHTPTPFVNACNEFKYVENIAKAHEDRYYTPNQAQHTQAKSNVEDDELKDVTDQDIDPGKVDRYLISILLEAYDMVDQESEWVDLRKLANNLKKLYPAFDHRTYGYSKLSKLVIAYENIFDINRDSNNMKCLIKRKESKPKK